ncbi:MAG: septation protein SpoVG family protein [Candidatus Omnitrophota bacterium]|jgi:stage V sporulation protein G
MEITEVRVFLKDSPDKKLKAYATVTFDNAFVVRNIKVIEGNNGVFIAMPSRKLKFACPKCGFKNEIRSKYCNQCGAQLPFTSAPAETDAAGGAQSEHKDIAHPITQSFREYLQKKILDIYEQEKRRDGAGVRADQEFSVE